MAVFPCDYGAHRYPGAQQTIYPAVVDGLESARRKLRLCAKHFEISLDQLKAHANSDQADEFDETFDRCFICAEPVTQSTAQLYATVYGQRRERVDFWAPLHFSCVAAAKAMWLLDAVMP